MRESTAIRRGIFQGDSLSALPFCMSLFPLTLLLNQQQFEYVVRSENVIYLLCMDDLKLFTKDEDQLKQALVIVKNFSTDIQRSFGLGKCATVIIRNGKVEHSTDSNIDCNNHIKSIGAYENFSDNNKKNNNNNNVNNTNNNKTNSNNITLS